jgi:hypothetical protein
VNWEEAAIVVFGLDAVEHFKLVKSFQTKLGHEFERSFAQRVGGRLGEPGGADVITERGEFDFRSQGNTKNAAGRAAEIAGGRTIVQMNGTPVAGAISAVEFLRLHDVKQPEREALICQALAAFAAGRDAEEGLR